MKDLRTQYGKSSPWVVKVGSSIVTADGQGLDHDLISQWASQIALLRQAGKEVVLVSSGAVAEGMARLGWTQRPHALHQLQAAAAVGQMGLVQAYESVFQSYDMHTAQILLTYGDFTDRARYLNARSALRTLLSLGVIPVVNENDTVSTEEIRLGDNDSLASMVANLIEAELLVILTDQEGVYDADPRTKTNAQRIVTMSANDPALLAMSDGNGGSLGRGGMRTKILAAERAARSGAATCVASGRVTDVLHKIAEGADVGTLLTPDQPVLAARKQWINSHMQSKGILVLDNGAVEVLRRRGTSLLPVGVSAVSGNFVRGDLVVCEDQQGVEVGRGFVNYNAGECQRLLGQPSSVIESVLGYVAEPELIHRDNLVVR